MWRDTSSAKQTRDMRGELCLSKPLSAAVDTQPASNATVGHTLMNCSKDARKSHKAAMKHHKIVKKKSLSLQQKQPELDLSAEVAARLNLVDRETPTHTDTLNSTEELPRFSKVSVLFPCNGMSVVC